MPRFDLSLYLVLDPDQSERSGGLMETARAAVAGGVTIVQLRAPQWKKRRMTEAARALRTILAPKGIPLIIDDHADVMLASGAEGLHVGQEDLSAEDARRLISPDKILGLSAGNLMELRGTRPELVDYYGVGPVFSTRSKADAGAAIGIAGLQEALAEARHPCVAIGGITKENAPQIGAAGADGIAVISALCGQPDVELAARNLLQAYRCGIQH